MDNAVISSIDGTPQSYPRPPARVAPPRHPGLRPRKVRRGTSSCWECRRRKVRCTFDASTTVCTPCERRGAECIGQHLQPGDHCDSQGQSANYENLSRSLVRVEALVSDLLGHESEGSLPNEAPFKQRTIRPKLSDRLSSSSSDLLDSSSHLNEPYSAFKDCTSHVFGHPREEIPHDGRSQQSSQKNALAPSMNEYSHLSHSLLSVMPPPGTTRAILRKTGYADLLIQMIRKTYGECPESSVQGQPLASFGIPDPTAHPISIARNLLLIALSLQIREEVAPSSSKKMVLSQSTKESSHRYFNAATRNVTSKDQLVTSPEGLETLMLEGLYQITSGNLQLGWLTFRRAIGIAQLIGLASESQECAESDWNPTKTCTVSTSSFLWFRLNYSDRVLSLIMGLPFATPGDGFASPEVLAADVPMGRLERMHTVVMGHLISRNQRIARAENTQHALRTEAKETQHIDEELFQISAQFPRKWWLSPHLESLMPQAADSMNETLRLLAQMNQAHLLLALHVPYAMHAFSAGPQPDCSYSMQNTIQASRDLLSRFILYRESNRMPVCCRVLDFKAFTASASLLLTHINGHHLGHRNTIRHHRQEDLGVVEMAVTNIKAHTKLSPISQGKAQVRILEALIDIEARAAEGLSYSIQIDSRWFSGECSVLGQGQPFEFGAPFFGRVRIQSLATAEPAVMTDLGLSIEAFEMMPSTVSRDPIGGLLPEKQLPLGYPSLSIPGSLSAMETMSASCQGSNGWPISYADCESSNAVYQSTMNF